MTSIFEGCRTKDGLHIPGFTAHCQEAYKVGDAFVVEVRKRQSKRSDEQNRYWHGVVVKLLAEHCGYEPDEMHEALKFKFLGTEDISKGLVKVGSSAKLSTAEFATLVDRVVLWAAEELGVIIPAPDPQAKWRAA